MQLRLVNLWFSITIILASSLRNHVKWNSHDNVINFFFAKRKQSLFNFVFLLPLHLISFPFVFIYVRGLYLFFYLLCLLLPSIPSLSLLASLFLSIFFPLCLSFLHTFLLCVSISLSSPLSLSLSSLLFFSSQCLSCSFQVLLSHIGQSPRLVVLNLCQTAAQ
jgi:hypothetical protein